jgi:hypothetical protein
MFEIVLDIFLITLMVAGIFCTLLGLLTVFYWFKPAEPPADTSNRINNITSWWTGLTRTNVMAKEYKFFRQDVMDNINDVETQDEVNRHREK